MILNLQFIAIPLLTCLILLSITSYFGIHVLKREIIFIDIALAQIAALGGVTALMIEDIFHVHEIMLGGYNISNLLAYVFSLLYCLGAAIIFSALKNPKIKVPIEAFIGIAYAFATTAAVIILDKGTGGDVHLHEMLTGTLLWTNWGQLVRLSITVLLVGGFHIVFRKKFIQLSETYNSRAGINKQQKLWDFLFYFTFSIVVIEAVEIAGVLTVFAFLIFPAAISALFSVKWNNRILIGLIAGIIATLLGLYISITMDLTASPLIILFMGAILFLGIIARSLRATGIRSK